MTHRAPVRQWLVPSSRAGSAAFRQAKIQNDVQDRKACGAMGMKIVPLLAAPVMISACTADPRPALTQEQFSEIVGNCQLPATVELDTAGGDYPMIVLGGADISDSQIDCIRSEQDRIGATADMAN